MALKIDSEMLMRLEMQHPGIGESIRHYEQAKLPLCKHCGSLDTAMVSIGIVGRSVAIAMATSRFKLLANDPKHGKYFCNACQGYFGDRGEP